MNIGRPEENEIAPWTRPYVERVEGDDIVDSLTRQRDSLLATIAGLDGTARYAPGKWTVAEILGHVSDAERIFSFRTLCVARGEQAPLPGFEQDEYMAKAHFASRSLADIAGEFEAVRESSIRLLRGFPAEVWLNRGTVGGFSVTTRGLAFVLAGHEKHHTQILQEKFSIV